LSVRLSVLGVRDRLHALARMILERGLRLVLLFHKLVVGLSRAARGEGERENDDSQIAAHF
jgi:hypothetical protein